MNSLNDAKTIRLCQIQAEIFVNSLKKEISSSDFIIAYLSDDYVSYFDDKSYFSNFIDAKVISEHVQCKTSKNIVKYSETEMHWIGYILRYWAIKYDITSKALAKIINPNDLRELYLTLHSQSIDSAIDALVSYYNYKPIQW